MSLVDGLVEMVRAAARRAAAAAEVDSYRLEHASVAAAALFIMLAVAVAAIRGIDSWAFALVACSVACSVLSEVFRGLR